MIDPSVLQPENRAVAGMRRQYLDVSHRLQGAKTADAGHPIGRRTFLHAGKLILTVDWEDEDQRAAIERVLATAQILVTQ